MTTTGLDDSLGGEEVLSILYENLDKDDEENLGTNSVSLEKLPTARLKREKNILTRLQSGSFQGPLQLLWRCSREARVVRVWIRSSRGVHAICCGQLAAFDAHFNLAMIDVDELAVERQDVESGRKARKKKNRQKRRRKLAIARQEAKGGHSTKRVGSQYKVGHDNIVDLDPSYRIIRRRHIAQLFIRGDEVLIISPVPESSK